MDRIAALLKDCSPPSRETWELVVWGFKYFPLFTAVQWLTEFYPQGKTSIDSRFNLPGKWAWTIMELPGVLTVWYMLFTVPPTIPHVQDLRNLPPGNWTLVGLFTIHYAYRAVISPLFLNPSMSPIHPFVFFSAFGWQVLNGLSIGGYVAGYGPTSAVEWTNRLMPINLGLFLWVFSFLGNVFHDDELREIRRVAMRRQRREIEEQKKKGVKPGHVSVDKVYMMPKNGLFNFILFPHYFCEWLEWCGFWMIGGSAFIPGRSFVFNEISTMLPRALSGRRWYIKRFGEKEVGSRKAVIPGLL